MRHLPLAVLLSTALLLASCVTPEPFEIVGQDLARPHDHERADHLPAPPESVSPYGVDPAMLAPVAGRAVDDADRDAVDALELGLDALRAGHLDEADARFLAVAHNAAVSPRWGAHAHMLRAEVIWRRWLSSPVDDLSMPAWQVSLDQHRRRWHLLETLYAQVADDDHAPRWLRVAAHVRAAQAADIARRQHLALADCPTWVAPPDCARFDGNLAATASAAHARALEHLDTAAALAAGSSDARVAAWTALAVQLERALD